MLGVLETPQWTRSSFFVYTDFCFCFSLCALLLQWQWFGCFGLGAVPGVGDVHVIVSLTCSNTPTCVQSSSSSNWILMSCQPHRVTSGQLCSARNWNHPESWWEKYIGCIMFETFSGCMETGGRGGGGHEILWTAGLWLRFYTFVILKCSWLNMQILQAHSHVHFCVIHKMVRAMLSVTWVCMEWRKWCM